MKLLKPEVFGAKLNPPKSGHTIRRLIRQGRIKGAVRPGNEWLVPENARIVGIGRRDGYGKYKGLSAPEYARLHGRQKNRVYVLFREGKLEGATRGEHGIDIPADLPWPTDDGF